jgi:polyisoprenoid-binding protein YceI
MTTAEAVQIAAGTWTIDTKHSLIEFAARHYDIAYVKGRFRTFSGTIAVDEQDVLKSSVDLTIEAGSLESQAVQTREDILNGEEMLDTAKYPEISFKSRRIQSRDLNHYIVTGDLTVRGITREVDVPMALNGVVTTRTGPAVGFSGNLELKLSDFQVPYTREFEPGRPVVGDDVKIELQIEAKLQPPA